MVTLILSLIVLYFVHQYLRNNPTKRGVVIAIDVVIGVILYFLPYVIAQVLPNTVLPLFISFSAFIPFIVEGVYILHILYVIFDFKAPLGDGTESKALIETASPGYSLLFGGITSIVVAGVSYIALLIAFILFYPPNCE